MKARHIRKLRKRIAKFDAYDIHESVSMFGAPYHVTAEATIMADNPFEAMRRFFRYYRRHYKRIHDNYKSESIETTQQWGRFEVVNLRTGFHHYMR